MQSKMIKAALVLGLLSVVGPFAIDMYLPTLPAIGQALGADTAAVQASLMAYHGGHCGLPAALWPDQRHGRAQAAALFRHGGVRRRIDRLRARAIDRVADRVPIRAGRRRLCGDGAAARHRARLLYRRRGRPADEPPDAGVLDLADPGTAGRQPGDPVRRLAGDLLGDGRGRRARLHPDRRSGSRRRGPLRSGSRAMSAARSAATGSCCATATSSASA